MSMSLVWGTEGANIGFVHPIVRIEDEGDDW
jgi:hypothetical protein